MQNYSLFREITRGRGFGVGFQWLSISQLHILDKCPSFGASSLADVEETHLTQQFMNECIHPTRFIILICMNDVLSLIDLCLAEFEHNPYSCVNGCVRLPVSTEIVPKIFASDLCDSIVRRYGLQSTGLCNYQPQKRPHWNKT